MNSNRTLFVFMLLIGAYLAMAPLKMMANTIDIKGISKYKLHPSIDQMNLSDLEDVFEDSKSFFTILDQDGDGNISAKELNHVLLLLGEKIPMSSVKAMIDILDHDSNGSISLKEFLSLKPEEQTELREGIEDMIISQIKEKKRKGDATEEEEKFVYCVLEKRNGELIKKSMIHDMENGKASKGFSLEDTKASKGFSLKDMKASMTGFSLEEMKGAMAYTPKKGKHYKCNYREEMKYAGMSPEDMKHKGMQGYYPGQILWEDESGMMGEEVAQRQAPTY